MKKQNAVNYGIDWRNVYLGSAFNRDQPMLDPYSFNTLLLEIECNLPEITEATVREQALKALESKVNSFKEILENNLSNITKHAQKERAKP